VIEQTGGSPKLNVFCSLSRSKLFVPFSSPNQQRLTLFT